MRHWKRTSETRHLIMLSFGGVLVQVILQYRVHRFHHWSGGNAAGPVSDGALVVWLVMQCLGELSVAMPETGAFHVMPRHLGPATGYTVALALLADLGPWRWVRALPPLDSVCSTGFHRCRYGSGAWCSARLFLVWIMLSHALFAEGVLVLAGQWSTIVAFIILGGAGFSALFRCRMALARARAE